MDYPLICISDLLPCCVYFCSFAVLTSWSLRVDYFASAAAPPRGGACDGIQRDARLQTEAFSDSTMFDIGMPGRGNRMVSAYRDGSAVAFGTEHHNQRIGFETGFANEGVAATVETDAVVSAFLQAFNGFGEVHHAGDRACARLRPRTPSMRLR